MDRAKSHTAAVRGTSSTEPSKVRKERGSGLQHHEEDRVESCNGILSKGAIHSRLTVNTRIQTHMSKPTHHRSEPLRRLGMCAYSARILITWYQWIIISTTDMM